MKSVALQAYQLNYQHITRILILFFCSIILFSAFNIITAQRALRSAETSMQIQDDFQTIANALEIYKRDHHSYPSTHQGLRVLYIKPETPGSIEPWNRYLKEAPIDPWGKIYRYQHLVGKDGFRLFSFGIDGVYRNKVFDYKKISHSNDASKNK